MTDVGQDTSDETRRRLLKGALAASTVVTLGYGGAAAAASLGCIEKLGSVDLPDSLDSNGDEVGSYSEALESDGVPVTGSCLASINPGLPRTTFSG